MSSNLSSQDLVLLDFKSNQPLVHASVYNVGNGKIDYSDTKGEVFLTEASASHDFLVTMVGYHELLITADQRKKQEDKTFYLIQRTVKIPDAVVSVFGRLESLSEVPSQIDVIGLEKLKFLNPQTSADAIQASGKVLVQKTQQGGGSPVIRGFEANKILLVVDGVRMNNAIYRSGHIQNSITVDVNILQQAEVIFGPGSVMYGSDALGGVIHYRTKKPELSASGDQEVKVNLAGRLGSVNQEQLLHVDLEVAEGKVASLTSFSRAEFGDLRMGSRRSHGDSVWGLVPEYVAVDGFQDLIIENSNDELQRRTGYTQIDFLQKFRYDPLDSLSLIANFQYSTSTHIQRFDRLNDYRNGRLRWAEWSYGPQERLLASLAMKFTEKNALFDEFNANIAYQSVEESRHKRLVYDPIRNSQIENVKILSTNLDFMRRWRSKTQLNYGAEWVTNDVTSVAQDRNLETLEVTDAATRYPDGGSTMSTIAVYASAKHHFNARWNLQFGSRLTRANLESNYRESVFYDLSFNQVRLNNMALTGSAGLIWKPDSTWQINAIFASAYRIPNVDDFGKVRENGGFVIVPTNELGPEKVYSAELNASKLAFDDHVQISAGGFHSWYRNAIVARSAQLDGQDSLFIEGAIAKVEKNANTNQAVVYGGFLELKWAITKDLSGSATFNYTYGQDLTEGIPLAHIPPIFGRIGAEYIREKFRGEFFINYNGKKGIDRYAPGGADKIEEALASGTPSWYTFNMSTSYYISKTLEAQFGVDNILDEHYIAFSSGVSAPGRNIYLGLRARF